MVSRWVDLGDGTAIDASLVRKLTVSPPWPPSTIRLRAFIEQLDWCVRVLDHRQVVHLVAHYPTEGAARSHARQIVEQMLSIED